MKIITFITLRSNASRHTHAAHMYTHAYAHIHMYIFCDLCATKRRVNATTGNMNGNQSVKTTTTTARSSKKQFK